MNKRMEWSEIDGWFAHEDFYRFLLSNVPCYGRVVEVGVLCGKSIVYLAQKSQQLGLGLALYGVDIFKTTDEYKPWLHNYASQPSFYELYMRNLFAAKVETLITTLAMPSVNAATMFENGSLDCVFIDAAHDVGSVSADIMAWRPKVKAGGFLAGDDYATPWGVVQAVDTLLPQRKLMKQTWWVQV